MSQFQTLSFPNIGHLRIGDTVRLKDHNGMDSAWDVVSLDKSLSQARVKRCEVEKPDPKPLAVKKSKDWEKAIRKAKPV